MLIGAAFFARPLAPATLVAAMGGGVVPDWQRCARGLGSNRVLGGPEQEGVGRGYGSDAWQAIFAVEKGWKSMGKMWIKHQNKRY